jgi:hypothetical protein
MGNASLREIDALHLLTREQGTLRRRFGDYERLVKRRGNGAYKALLAGQICFRLSIHLQIEEELFYPAAQAAIGNSTLVNHAVRDHDAVKALIAMLDKMRTGDTDYDAAVAVLGAWVLPYFDEEQGEIFPKLRVAGMETATLGRRMASRQKTLQRDATGIGLPHPAARASAQAARAATTRLRP